MASESGVKNCVAGCGTQPASDKPSCRKQPQDPDKRQALRASEADEAVQAWWLQLGSVEPCLPPASPFRCDVPPSTRGHHSPRNQERVRCCIDLPEERKSWMCGVPEECCFLRNNMRYRVILRKFKTTHITGCLKQILRKMVI